MGDNEKVEVTLNLDDDGFISQECPACGKKFKVKYGEGSDKPLSFCPYCRHNGRDCWWTEAQAEYLAQAVGHELLDPRMARLAKDFNRKMPSGGLVTLKMEYEPGPEAVAPEEANNGWPTVSFECCGESFKHDRSTDTLCCIICGSERRVARQ